MCFSCSSLKLSGPSRLPNEKVNTQESRVQSKLKVNLFLHLNTPYSNKYFVIRDICLHNLIKVLPTHPLALIGQVHTVESPELHRNRVNTRKVTPACSAKQRSECHYLLTSLSLRCKSHYTTPPSLGIWTPRNFGTKG